MAIKVASGATNAPIDRQLRYAAGVQYDWNANVTLGLAYTLVDAGDADINQTRGPLSGTLQGDYSTNQIHFVNVIWKFGQR